MQEFRFHFPSPPSDHGKSLLATIIKLNLDMTRMCPFIFHITQSPYSSIVLNFFMTIHIQLFQILLLHIRSQKLSNANIVIELAMWKIIVLIFTHASIVVSTIILQTYSSKTSLLQEYRFILDGMLPGNGLQRPRRYFSHMSELVLEYWIVLQLIFLQHLTLYLTGGNDGHIQASNPHQASLSHNLLYHIQSCSQRQRWP